MSIPGGSGFAGGKFGKLPSNFARAYDLSGLARKPDQPGSGNSSPSASTDGNSQIREVTEANIVTDFIEYSNQKPVIIFIWSDRAKGSSEMLAILAKLAAQDGQKWRLGAIAFDKTPELAQALRVTAIPAAVAFIQEKALPIPQLPPEEASLRLVINKIMEIATQQGMDLNNQGSETSIASAPVAEPEEDEAYQAIERGDFQSAAAAFKRLLERKPHDAMTQQGLAQCELMIRTQGVDPRDAIAKADASPNDLAANRLAADIEVGSGMFEAGFNRLITFIKKNPGDQRKEAKEHLLLLFSVVPPEEPTLIKARRELASALF